MDNRKELTNKKIRDAYISELKENPDFSPSIKAICITSGINRTTFYRYYNSVDDLEVNLIVEGLGGFFKKYLINGDIFEKPEQYFKELRDSHVIRDNTVFKILRARGDAPLPPEAIDQIMNNAQESMGDKFDRYKLAFAMSGGLGVIFLDQRARQKEPKKWPPKPGEMPPEPPCECEPGERENTIIDRLCAFYKALKDI